MGRRKFITLLGGVAASPLLRRLTARAQQPATPVVGFLNQGSAKSDSIFAVSFRQGLNEVGYVEGQNVAIEYRWAEGDYNQLPQQASDLVRRQVSVMATAYAAATVAAKAATSDIPIVFITGTDPVQSGLVPNLNRPGGNVTGVAIFNVLLGAKRLGLLHELLPAARTFALLSNPTNPLTAGPFRNGVQTAADALRLEIIYLSASTEHEIDQGFATIIDRRISGLIIGTDAFLNSRQDYIVSLAARNAIPTMYDRREDVVAGGLTSYGTDFADTYRQQGTYVGRILKGKKPADLPVTQPTKFEFVLNMRTAKALNLTIPSGVLAIADEVIE